MDGVENRDPNLLGVPLFPPPEAIAQMKVESGASSGVYGHGSGATVNLVTKSGTNAWHGDGWEFLRNNALDARSFLCPPSARSGGTSSAAPWADGWRFRTCFPRRRAGIFSATTKACDPVGIELSGVRAHGGGVER